LATTHFFELAAGTLRVGTVEGRGARARLTAYHEERITVEDSELPRVLPAMLESAASRLRISGGSLVFAISSKFLVFREASFPFSDKRRVERTLPFQVEESLPHPLDEVVLDSFEISSNGSSSTYYVCCIQKKLLRAIMEGCSEFGCDPAVVAPSFIGIPYAMHSEELRLVLDLGNETTDMVLTAGNKVLVARTLRLAGKTLTRAIADALSVEPSVAEETKILSQGLDDRVPALNQTFSSELTRLAREVRLTLSALPPALMPKSIAVIGGGASIRGIADFLSKKLGTPCEAFDASRFPALQGLPSAPKTSGFAPPFGLALLENQSDKPQANFRRGEFGYHGIFDKIAIPLLILLLLLAGLLGMGIWHFRGENAKAKMEYASAVGKLRDAWMSVIPEPPPTADPFKYVAFIEERKKKLAEEQVVRSKYYRASVLPHIKSLEEIMRDIPFKMSRLEAGKTAITISGEIDNDPDTLKRINETATRGMVRFADVSPKTQLVETVLQFSVTCTYRK
jgi:Tfp pilus assembly PilM family ATPase